MISGNLVNLPMETLFIKTPGNQDVATIVPLVANAPAPVAVAVCVAIDPISIPVESAAGSTIKFINSNSSCTAIDLASGSWEFFKIWFFA